MTDQLRHLLADLAEQAPVSVDAAAIRRGASRRQSTAIGAAAVVLAASGLGASLLLVPASSETLVTGPFAAAPSSRASSPNVQPTGAAIAAPEPSPASPDEGDEVRGLPQQVIAVDAADGSRVGIYRTGDAARISWLSPPDPGYGVSHVVISDKLVLFSAGNAEKDTRNVRLVVHPSRPDAGVSPSEPGTFLPAVLDDGSRYATLATGDDGGYSPRSPGDLRLVLTETDAGVQAAVLDASWLVAGLTFASPDRLALSVTRPGDQGRHGLQVFDFQTDEASLGSRAPETRFLPAPAGCSWTLPTSTPVPDQVLVIERCGGPSGGAWDAVTVDVTTGDRVSRFGTVLPDGPGQVDSLDLDLTGKHLIAQTHAGGGPASGVQASPSIPAMRTVSVEGGRSITTTQRLISPAWR